jgi:hypothetical protein
MRVVTVAMEVATFTLVMDMAGTLFTAMDSAGTDMVTLFMVDMDTADTDTVTFIMVVGHGHNGTLFKVSTVMEAMLVGMWSRHVASGQPRVSAFVVTRVSFYIQSES